MSPLYKVKLTWGVLIDAPNMQAAHSRAVEMLKKSPEGFISGIESGTLAKSRSLIGRIITGK